ncbi:hypothetical protein DFJ63DRAFT_124435 [Scheffersomyces coipomensis]|uniref:uncharacterized protein n=1 Tax=Scheffersomyces coipomensis TaxID=1788519 RepID=UPI00315DA9EF
MDHFYRHVRFIPDNSVPTRCKSVPGLITDNDTIQFILGFPRSEIEITSFIEPKIAIDYEEICQLIESEFISSRRVDRLIIMFHIEGYATQENGESNLGLLVDLINDYGRFFYSQIEHIDIRFCCGICENQDNLDVILQLPNLTNLTFSYMDLTWVDFENLECNSLCEINFNKVQLADWSKFRFPPSLKRLTVDVVNPTPVKCTDRGRNYLMFTDKSIRYSKNQFKQFPIPDGLDYLKLDIPDLDESLLELLLSPITSLSELVITHSRIRFLKGWILPSNLTKLVIETYEHFDTDYCLPATLDGQIHISYNIEE